jgi:ABC-type Zn2+ transport system substrate-binding protein/surface adhesin
MTAKVERLPDHILDADVLTNEVGAWFAHEHEHEHEQLRAHEVAGSHRHRHDHRRRSHRGDYDHHPLDPAGDGG